MDGRRVVAFGRAVGGAGRGRDGTPGVGGGATLLEVSDVAVDAVADAVLVSALLRLRHLDDRVSETLGRLRRFRGSRRVAVKKITMRQVPMKYKGNRDNESATGSFRNLCSNRRAFHSRLRTRAERRRHSTSPITAQRELCAATCCIIALCMACTTPSIIALSPGRE